MDVGSFNWSYLVYQFASSAAVLGLIVLTFVLVKSRQTPEHASIFVGLATAWVAVYQIAMSIIWGLIMLINLSNPMNILALFEKMMAVLWPVNWLTGILSILLIIFYLFHIIKSPVLSKEARFIYGIGLFVLPFIVMPIYYIRFIREK